jgi:hypothetical protein
VEVGSDTNRVTTDAHRNVRFGEPVSETIRQAAGTTDTDEM